MLQLHCRQFVVALIVADFYHPYPPSFHEMIFILVIICNPHISPVRKFKFGDPAEKALQPEKESCTAKTCTEVDIFRQKLSD